MRGMLRGDNDSINSYWFIAVVLNGYLTLSSQAGANLRLHQDVHQLNDLSMRCDKAIGSGINSGVSLQA